jgi:hypothetical protein
MNDFWVWVITLAIIIGGVWLLDKLIGKYWYKKGGQK